MLHILEAKIGNENVFSIELEDGVSAIFQSMTLAEHASYKEFITVYPAQVAGAEEFVFKKYVIQYVDQYSGLFYLRDAVDDDLVTYEELIDLIPAGAITSTSSAILSISTPDSIDQLEQQLNLARYNQQQDLVGMVVSLLATAYNMNIDTIKQENTWLEIVDMFAHAESVLTGNVPELPLKIDRNNKKDIVENSD